MRKFLYYCALVLSCAFKNLNIQSFVTIEIYNSMQIKIGVFLYMRNLFLVPVIVVIWLRTRKGNC